MHTAAYGTRRHMAHASQGMDVMTKPTAKKHAFLMAWWPDGKEEPNPTQPNGLNVLGGARMKRELWCTMQDLAELLENPGSERCCYRSPVRSCGYTAQNCTAFGCQSGNGDRCVSTGKDYLSIGCLHNVSLKCVCQDDFMRVVQSSLSVCQFFLKVMLLPQTRKLVIFVQNESFISILWLSFFLQRESDAHSVYQTSYRDKLPGQASDQASYRDKLSFHPRATFRERSPVHGPSLHSNFGL